ncbi:MAG: sialate O-acetylesterase, partial [Verrucomicrobiaceae bacterium]
MTEIAPDKLILKLSQYSGPVTVKASISNGGAETVATASVKIVEPKNDPWLVRTPGKDEKPDEGQFFTRDDNNEGTLHYNGTLTAPTDSVFLKVYADDKLIKTETQKPAADNTYGLSAKIKGGLIKYKVEFGTKIAGAEKVEHTVTNLVCGDAYLIDGQSNALALDTGEQSPNETSEWIRTYGGPTGRGDASDWVRDRFGNGKRPSLWSTPAWRPYQGSVDYLGWWGMELAKRLLATQKIPVCIIQAAVGGTRIDEHKPTESNHLDLTTMYGKMLWRVQNARLTHGIRGVLWHQGEADQGLDGPDGGYGWETYQRYFVNMSLAWKQDMPNIRHYYVFQIWPNGCGQGSGHGDMLREVQRTLPRLYSNMDVMPTLGIKPPGPCHYPLVGWSEFVRLLQPLIERDFYGKKPSGFITAPNLVRAFFASPGMDSISLEFDQPVVWTDSLKDQFYLDGEKDKVASGTLNGNVLTLKLKEATVARKISYIKETNWTQDKLIIGANGIAALTFCEVPLAVH